MRAIVIGSGASGSTVARLLALSGNYTVLVLEKGRDWFTGLGSGEAGDVGNAFANDEIGYQTRSAPISQDVTLEPRSFRYRPEDGARTFVGDVNTLPTTVGGGTVHYDAKARRFREVDFTTNSLMGGTVDSPAVSGTTYADWPMQYRHLEPFYAVAEEIVGVQGPAYRDAHGAVVNPNPNESARSTPHPMPPGVAMYSNLIQADAARRLGYSPAAVPTSINSRPYRGRPACNDCAHCLGYGCPVNAKGGGVWQLHEALRTGRVELRSSCRVVRLVLDDRRGASGRMRVRGVEYLDAGGAMHTELADLVVLANTPIEAVRLSFLSGIGLPAHDDGTSATWGRLRPSATDPSGMLGRNLMFHLQTMAIGIFDQDIHPWRGRTSTHTLDEFVGPGPTPEQFRAGLNANIPRGGITELGGNIDPVSEAIQVMTLAYGAAHKQLMRLSPFRRHLAAFTLQGEDMPQATNAVDLDPQIVDIVGQPVPRVTYQSHRYELAAAAYYIPKLVEVMATIGGPGSAYPNVQTLVAAPLGSAFPAVDLPSTVGLVTSAAFNPIPKSRHIMGTHRMALDHEHGATDPYGRYWAFDNLYHAGGGLFVTAPGYNVTLTIWALSYWVATAILAGVGGAAAYDAASIDANWRRQLQVLQTLDADTMIARVLSRGASAAAGTGAASAGGIPSTSRGGGGQAAGAAAAGAIAVAAAASSARRTSRRQRNSAASKDGG